MWLKQKVMDKLCLGEDFGNGFPEDGNLFHVTSEKFHYSSWECRMGGGSGDGWGGTAGSEAGQWAGTQPEGPLMYKKVFGLLE